ncbi:metal-dependent hydrolase [Candidatus Woesearchaeota archaeon]|nr:metal-dependent hydrolase [Candidatus Woesearchaeota archaeon]
MPNARLHQIIGILLVVIFLALNYIVPVFSFSVIDIILLIPIILFYSILPDIDIASSRSRRMVTAASLVIILACFWLDKKWLGISISVALLLLELVKHRTFIHSITTALVFSLPFWFYNPKFFVVALVSYLSHLALDREVKLF